MQAGNTQHETTSYKPYIRALVAAAAGLLLLVALSVAVVDPFFHYHKPLRDFPYVVDNQLSQNPGMARQLEYDAVIVGSSMTVNFDTDDFRQAFGLETVKLSYSGAYPKDIANMLDVVFDAKPEVKAVFLSVDLPTYTGDTDEVKYPRPEYLYDNNPFNDVKYLLNKDVFLQYVVRPVLNPNPTDLSMVYASWWTEEYYDEARVLAGYELPENAPEVNAQIALKQENARLNPAAAKEAEDSGALQIMLERTKENLEANLLPFLEAHEETTFYFFFPPYSILYWYATLAENRTEIVMEQSAYVAEQLLAYDNVRLFFFQDLEETVCDLNRYADYSHYHPEVNREMVQYMAEGICEIHDAKEMEARLEKMRQIVYRYDFEALFAKKES